MKFIVTYKNGKQKIICAKDLEDAEKKAPKTWTDIIYKNISDIEYQREA